MYVLPERNGFYLYDFNKRGFVSRISWNRKAKRLQVAFTRDMRNAERYCQRSMAILAADKIFKLRPDLDITIATHLMAWTLNEMHKRQDREEVAALLNGGDG